MSVRNPRMKRKTAEFTMFEFMGGSRDGLVIGIDLKRAINNEFHVCTTDDIGQTTVEVYRLKIEDKKAEFFKATRLK